MIKIKFQYGNFYLAEYETKDIGKLYDQTNLP